MKSDSFINKKSVNTGILGALAGTLTSVLLHKPHDKPVNKAAKTGLFAAIGFLMGSMLQNRSWRR
jgi:uncharacterized membrane protein YebE (DUF533 family)